MENKQRYSVKSPGRGGARPGAGRPAGSTTKIKIEDLLQDIEAETKMPYSRRLAMNYSQAIDRSDWTRVENYDRAFLSKIVADRLDVEISDPGQEIEARRAAFLSALEQVANVIVPSDSSVSDDSGDPDDYEQEAK
jgi:hypothetical protein